MSLVLELLHTITKTWDYYGAPPNIVLQLTKESADELFNSTFGNPDGIVGSADSKTNERYISIDTYNIKIVETK